MANEVTNAALTSNGGRVAELLSALLHPDVYDATDLRAIAMQVPWDGNGSSTITVTKTPAPGPAAAASSETSGGASNSAYATSEFTLTAARRLRILQMTDLAALTTPDAGGVGFAALLANLIEAEVLTLTDMFCSTAASFTDNVGTAGAQFTVDDFFSAVYALRERNVTARDLVLHNNCFSHFEDSVRDEGGAIQYRTDVQAILEAGATGLQGSFAGVNLWVSDSVVTANATVDRSNFMVGEGALAYALPSISKIASGMIGAPDVLLMGDSWFIERDRDAANGMTSAILNIYPATAIADDDRGVTIETKSAL